MHRSIQEITAKKKSKRELYTNVNYNESKLSEELMQLARHQIKWKYFQTK